MYLTEPRLRAVAKDARDGLAEALGMIAVHEGDSRRAFLNPATVLTTVATWERFVYDLLDADRDPAWTSDRAGSGKEVSYRAFPPPLKAPYHQWHDDLDRVAGGPNAVTDRWSLHISQGWRGVTPQKWTTASWTGEPASDHRDAIERHLRGAQTARHAVAHRIWHKQAHQASDEDGLYTWRADTVVRGGRPTIQQGYVRGVMALFIQLVDITIEAVGAGHGWHTGDCQLPSGWFASPIQGGHADGLVLWGGRELHR